MPCESELLYFEDLTTGRYFDTASVTLDAENIKRFAGEYDPQIFHLDEVAAKDTFFDGLAASGWQVSALTMRMVAQSELARVANGLIGMQVDEMRWPRPSRPGDTLRARATVTTSKRSASKPGFGIVNLLWETRNQHDELAVSMKVSIWVACRPQTA